MALLMIIKRYALLKTIYAIKDEAPSVIIL